MWKNINGYDGKYQVNELGEVRSVKYKNPRILKHELVGRGYPVVCLCNHGSVNHVYIHHLVANAFLTKPEDKQIINHKDGNKLNNQVSNLEYVSYSENNQHAYDTGLHGRGEKHYNAKLSESDVKQIKKEGKRNTYQDIADKYNVSKATVRDILIGKTWKAVNPT